MRYCIKVYLKMVIRLTGVSSRDETDVETPNHFLSLSTLKGVNLFASSVCRLRVVAHVLKDYEYWEASLLQKCMQFTI